MEKSLSRYIWKHTWHQQVIILLIVAVSMIPYFISLDLPKQIINGPIQGEGFSTPDAIQPFFELGFDMPLVGYVELYAGYPLDRLSMLMALSVEFLVLVVINNAFKYVINTYKGRLGERLLRRIRFQLIDRLLRFPPIYFKKTKSAEVASMIKDEVEPLGGFAGDAFVQPALLGGQVIAALAFILAQNLWLGLIAAFMALLQIGIIPRMRRRLIRLGRERQITARRLAGRVSEMVDGMPTIHAYDTSNYERADMARRLGEIFAIRYDLYQWKFMVKFINNFLAQITPFLFYSIGGYLTLRGHLDVGQLVAVINAYKELPSPLKDLIDWDQARQDVQVKFEQVVEQFQSDSILEPEIQQIYTGVPSPLPGPIAAINLAIDDDSGGRIVDHVSLHVDSGQTIAFLDANGSAGSMIADAIGRAVWPTTGKVAAGDIDLRELPESVTGRRISYVSAESYFFHGSLKDNLLYGLKHAPLRPREREGKAATRRRWEVNEARLAGNVDFDIEGEWISTMAAADSAVDTDTLNTWMLGVLDTVLLTEDVLDLALRSSIDPDTNAEIARFAVSARQTLRDELVKADMPELVIPFDFAAYNTEATVAENLLFGSLIGGDAAAQQIIASNYFRSIVRDGGLSSLLFEMGRSVAATIVELFGDMQQNNPLLPELPFMEGRELPDYARILKEIEGRGPEDANEEQRRAIFLTAFSYVESRYRFGLMTEEIMRKIVEARQQFHANLPPELSGLIARYEADGFQSSASLIENILFGKISRGHADAQNRIASLIRQVAEKEGIYTGILAIGLDYDLGPGGKRLTLLQRQKLNVARALIRQTEYCILNQPLPGLNPRLQAQLVNNVISFLREKSEKCTIIWVLSNPRLCKLFERIMVFDKGGLVADGTYETLVEENGIVKELVTR